MDNIEKYFKNKELLGFEPIVTVQNKKIKVEFTGLEKKYNPALSKLVKEICKDYIHQITEEYNKLNKEVLEELSKTKDKDIRLYIYALLQHGPEAYRNILDGTIKVCKNKVFYNGIEYKEGLGWMYNNQRIKI